MTNLIENAGMSYEDLYSDHARLTQCIGDLKRMLCEAASPFSNQPRTLNDPEHPLNPPLHARLERFFKEWHVDEKAPEEVSAAGHSSGQLLTRLRLLFSMKSQRNASNKESGLACTLWEGVFRAAEAELTATQTLWREAERQRAHLQEQLQQAERNLTLLLQSPKKAPWSDASEHFDPLANDPEENGTISGKRHRRLALELKTQMASAKVTIQEEQACSGALKAALEASLTAQSELEIVVGAREDAIRELQHTNDGLTRSNSSLLQQLQSAQWGVTFSERMRELQEENEVTRNELHQRNLELGQAQRALQDSKQREQKLGQVVDELRLEKQESEKEREAHRAASCILKSESQFSSAEERCALLQRIDHLAVEVRDANAKLRAACAARDVLQRGCRNLDAALRGWIKAACVRSVFRGPCSPLAFLSLPNNDVNSTSAVVAETVEDQGAAELSRSCLSAGDEWLQCRLDNEQKEKTLSQLRALLATQQMRLEKVEAERRSLVVELRSTQEAQRTMWVATHEAAQTNDLLQAELERHRGSFRELIGRRSSTAAEANAPLQRELKTVQQLLQLKLRENLELQQRIEQLTELNDNNRSASNDHTSEESTQK